MRQRSANQKAVEKLSTFLYEIRGRLANNEKVNFSELYTKHNISKSTLSALKKLGHIIDGESSVEWSNPLSQSDRVISLKILEFLRQQSDKQTDKPISDMWCQEVSQIKLLLSEIRDKLSEKNNRLEGLKIAHMADQSKNDRLETARMFASCMVSNREPGSIGAESIDLINQTAISLTDDLLSKLNS